MDMGLGSATASLKATSVERAVNDLSAIPNASYPAGRTSGGDLQGGNITVERAAHVATMNPQIAFLILTAATFGVPWGFILAFHIADWFPTDVVVFVACTLISSGLWVMSHWLAVSLSVLPLAAFQLSLTIYTHASVAAWAGIVLALRILNGRWRTGRLWRGVRDRYAIPGTVIAVGSLTFAIALPLSR